MLSHLVQAYGPMKQWNVQPAGQHAYTKGSIMHGQLNFTTGIAVSKLPILEQTKNTKPGLTLGWQYQDTV